jgi:hypothetical protein
MRFLAFLPVLFAVLFNACGGGGCGPNASPDTGAQQGPSNEQAGKKPVGGGPVDASEFDSKKWTKQQDYKGGPAGEAPRQPRALPPPQTDWLDPVTPTDWDVTVIQAKGQVLVMASKFGCADCSLAGSALKLVSGKMPAVVFRRFDQSAPEALSVLPGGLAAKEPPHFLLYEGGKAVSQLSGLPFPRAQNENDADYRTRLYRWFRDAITQKDLQFGRH